MTEWRAADLIRRIKGETADKYIDRHKAFDLAIKALEEIQQYREIGTVEEARKLKESSLSGLQLAMIAGSVKKQKKYEDLERQGKLLKLPCAAGDTVWDNDFGKPCSYTVTGFSIGKIDDEEENDIEGLQMYYQNWNGSMRCSCVISEINKTVFLTQSAAEAALKEMREYRQSIR